MAAAADRARASGHREGYQAIESARPGHVLGSALREGLALAGIGIALGVPAARAAARLVRGLLFGLSPADPATLAAAVLLALVCLLAAYLPARRAARLDPAAALRQP